MAGLDGFPIWDLATSSSFDHAARAAVEATLTITGLEIAYLTVYHEGDPPELEHRYITTSTDLSLPEGFTIPWDQSLCAQCRAEGLRWTASVPSDLPGVAAADALGITTFVSIPLTRLDDSLIGTLCAAGRDARYLDKTVLAALENAAVILADRFQREIDPAAASAKRATAGS